MKSLQHQNIEQMTNIHRMLIMLSESDLVCILDVYFCFAVATQWLPGQVSWPGSCLHDLLIQFE